MIVGPCIAHSFRQTPPQHAPTPLLLMRHMCCAGVASPLELQPLISSSSGNNNSESQEASLARQPANTSLQHSGGGGGSGGFWALMRRKEVWAICVAQYAGERGVREPPGWLSGSPRGPAHVRA